MISGTRKGAALVVAIISDALSVFTEFAPPVQWAVDIVTAVIIFGLLGFQWPLLPAIVIEAVPVLAAFPSWVVAVGYIAAKS